MSVTGDDPQRRGGTDVFSNAQRSPDRRSLVRRLRAWERAQHRDRVADALPARLIAFFDLRVLAVALEVDEEDVLRLRLAVRGTTRSRSG